MKNLEQSYLQTPLLSSKLDILIEQLNSKFQETTIKDEILNYFIFEYNKLLQSLYSPTFEKCESPLYLTQLTPEFYNLTFSYIINDLSVLMSEFEATENYAKEKINSITQRITALISYTKRIRSNLDKVGKYFYDTKNRYYWVVEEFADNSLIDLNSKFLEFPQCEINQTEGIITNSRKIEQGTTNLIVESIKINTPSNGSCGNSIIAYSNKRDNPMFMVDTDLSTWFEYEKIIPTLSNDNEPLYLDITIKLEKQGVLNNIVLEFLNSSNQDLVLIKEIKSSFDGNHWQDICSDIAVGKNKNDIGIVSVTTYPRTTRFINIKLQQGIPVKLKTGDKKRYFIAIKNLYLNSVKYNPISELISDEIFIPNGYNYISLLVSQFPDFQNKAYKYNYYISPDEANHWYELTPSNSNYLNYLAPKLLEFNTDSKDTIKLNAVPHSLRLKIRLTRNDAEFSKYYIPTVADTIVETEYFNALDLENFALLKYLAHENSIHVERVDVGSTGNSNSYLVAISNYAPNQEYKLPFNINNIDNTITVSGDKWEQVASFLSSTATDTHYMYNVYNNTIRFGDGVNGKIPLGPIELTLKQEIIGFSSDSPHIATLNFNCDGIKENVELVNILPLKYVNAQKLGKASKHIKLGKDKKNIYSYERVTEEIPRGTVEFILHLPTFVIPDIQFEDKSVFSKKVKSRADLKEAGDYYYEINELSKICSVYTKSTTSGNYAGTVTYNAVGTISPIKLKNIQPYDKQIYFIKLGYPKNELLTPYNVNIKLNTLIRLINKQGYTVYRRVITVQREKSGSWIHIGLDSALDENFIYIDSNISTDNITGYFLQVMQIKSMAPQFVSASNAFQRERPYIDGSAELEKHGDYSFNYEEGEIFTFTPTSEKYDDTISYYFEGETKVDNVLWDFYFENDTLTTNKIIIDDSTYREIPQTVNYVVDNNGYAYIKPGKGCTDFSYTRIKYTDEFLKNPMDPKSIFCGTTSVYFENNNNASELYYPGGGNSDINWQLLSLPTSASLDIDIYTNKEHYQYGNNLLAYINLANNNNNSNERIKADLYIDLQAPGGHITRLYEQRNMHIPDNYFVDRLTIIDMKLTKHYLEGRYILWFGIFKAGTTELISNIASTAYTYKSDTSHGEAADTYDLAGHKSLKTTFIPYTDLVRGVALQENSKVVYLGYKNIIKNSVKFICTDDSQICMYSLDVVDLSNNNKIHQCKKGFKYKEKDAAGDYKKGYYYNNYCENTDCPLYITKAVYQISLFSAEVEFINGATEFDITDIDSNDTKLYSIDYKNGILYTSFSIPKNMIITFSVSSHKIKYNIVLPLDDSKYEVKDNNRIRLIDRNLLNIKDAKVAVKYRRNKSYSTESLSKIREYFTPIVKNYILRVGKKFSDD